MIYVNGEWQKEAVAYVSINDLGFLYGDSLFETIRSINGRLFKPQIHFDRLENGFKKLRYENTPDYDTFLSLLSDFIMRNDFQNGMIRFIVTRGLGTMEAPWSYVGKTNIYIKGRPLPKLPDFPAHINFVNEEDYPVARFNPAIKSGNYLANMLAKKDADAINSFEPIFYNKSKYITEGALRNIFFIRGNMLFTPALSLGVLPGVIRNLVLKLAPMCNLLQMETIIRYEDIDGMDEAFITSTGIGILPVTWDGFESDSIKTYELMKLLDKEFYPTEEAIRFDNS